MIYEFTRYRKTPVVKDGGTQNKVFTARTLFNFPTEGAFSHVWKSHDRLDILSYKHYGTSQLWWVILDANPKYFWEGEIAVGDIILIPDAEMVVGRI